jgi:hypothetical protein
MSPIQIDLLREALRGVCAVCGSDLGLQQIPEGGKVPITCVGAGGFHVCEPHRNASIKLPDGVVLAP